MTVSSPNTAQSAAIITVRPSAEVVSRQQLPYFVAISHASAGQEAA